MTVNLRLSLTVFKVGFAAESASGFAALASGSNQLPFHGLIFFLNPAFTAFGILFLFVGRHEWNELHHARVGHANLAFAVSIIATLVAGGPVAYLIVTGASSAPAWLVLVFGVSIALVFGVTFITYVFVASHLVGTVGRVAMALGLAWSVLISALIGLALAPQLHPIAHTILSRSTNLDPILQPFNLLDALLGFSYLAFFVAFADAHYRVVKGLEPPDVLV